MKPYLKGKAIWTVIWVISCSGKGAIYTYEGCVSSLLFRSIDFQDILKTSKKVIYNFIFWGKNFLEYSHVNENSS